MPMGEVNLNSALRKRCTLISKENPFLYQQGVSCEVSGPDKGHLQDHLYACCQTGSHNQSGTQMSGPRTPTPHFHPSAVHLSVSITVLFEGTAQLPQKS